MKGRVRRRWHHEDEWYDEVTIKLVPRFKTSDLSGDEWRVGARVTISDKGHQLVQRSFGTMAYAALYLQTVIDAAKGDGRPEEEEDVMHYRRTIRPTLCDQPGCPDNHVSTYRIKEFFTKQGEPLAREGSLANDIHVRCFCQRHLDRGDSDREDCNQNYEVLDGPGPGESVRPASDESKAIFGGFIGGRKP